ncbi:hypothetical protein LO772_28585 [Yinghuangia sp. ASG 101]|uniref:hypothetical protein n=1 Tax=Yinghuangia sp. ASG 101 TaxID=2896848 RepID=UPI001E3162B8|nr:hypothetical protein [Yinghuangia sp. ASG 101]UGQ10746.1 hypothetical protein LO772_28585 [Yinghuangia sp. ASG 101]
MSNNVTLVPRVPVLRSTDAERPVELRFGPHTDAEGRPTEEWTVERLTLAQAASLVEDLSSMLGLPVGGPPELRVVS